MIIVRLLFPEPAGWFCHHQLYSGIGADIVMESVTLISRLAGGFEGNGLVSTVGRRTTVSIDLLISSRAMRSRMRAGVECRVRF